MKIPIFRRMGVSVLLAFLPSVIYLAVNTRAIVRANDAQGGIALFFLFFHSLFFFGVALVFWRALLELLLIMWQRDRPSNWERRSAVALVGVLVSTSIAAFALTDHLHHRQLDARLASSSEATLQKVFQTIPQDGEDRHWITLRLAENPHCPPEILEKLALEPDSGVRHRVAFNPRTSVDLLIRLASDPDSLVRGWLTHNPATPPDIMLKLQEDKDENVRRTASYFSRQRGL